MTNKHIAGLDVWRAALLMGGLFYHGTMLQSERLAFDLIEIASTAFRMAAFFAIAGFLAERSLRRRRPEDWIAGRSLRIGIPAMFGVTTISPLIWLMLIRATPPERSASVLPFEWHHLWFLFALLIYQVAAYWMTARVAPRRVARWLMFVRARGPAWTIVTLTVASLTLMVVTVWIVMLIAPAAYRPMLMEMRLITGYLPLYLLDMALSSSRGLRRRLLGEWRLPAAILSVVTAGYLGWRIGLVPRMPADAVAAIEVQIRFVIAAICPPAAVLLVMRSALRIRAASPLVQKLCAASFTIYIVHFPLMFAANLIAARYDAPPLIEYAAAVMAVGALSYAVHVGIVRRSPLAALMLNGRLPLQRETARVAR